MRVQSWWPGAQPRWVLGLPLLVALLAALLGAQFAAPSRVQVGWRDGRALDGVNAVEQIGGRAVRWTTGAGRLVLPRPLVNGPALLNLGLLNARPPGQPEPAVRLVADGTPLASFTLPDALNGEGRRFRLLVPPALGAELDLAVDSDVLLLPADPRPLGVVVTGAQLAPAAATLRLPPPLVPAALALLALCLGWALLAIGAPMALALALACAAPLGLAWGAALYPLEVLPFLPRMAGLGLLLCATLGLFTLFAPPNEDAPGLLAPESLPLAMGLAWWGMVAFQLIMLADGSRPAIAPQTLIIGVVVLVGLLALALARIVRGAAVTRPAVALLAVAALAHGLYLVWYAYTRAAPDFWIHFKGARGFVRDGLPLYDIPSIQANHFGFAYKWPPLYAALLAPFTGQSGELVLLGHRIMNTILLVASAALLLREGRIGARLSIFMLAALLMLFNIRPATDTIALGQFDIIVLFCCVLAWLAARRGRDGLAGALIAFLVLVKLYPLLLLGFFVATRRWRAAVGFVVGGLICTAYSVAVLGWQNHWIYLTDVVGRIGGGTAWIENQTFNGFASRLFATTIAAEKFDFLPVTLATYAFFALSVGLAMLLTYRLSIVAPQQVPLAFGLFVILMVMAVPAAWMHYEAAMILPFALLLLTWGQGPVSRGRVAGLALAYALITYGNQWSFFNGEVLGGLSILGYSYKFYGMLVLFAANAVAVARQRTVDDRRQTVARPRTMDDGRRTTA